MSVVELPKPVALAELDVQDFPKGMVILPCHDLARYHQFTHDMLLLDVPHGTYPSVNRSCSVVQNMNMGVEQLLESDAAWAWVIGDDHAFNRDTVVRLLRHQVDVVVPLCTKRGPPFSLVLHDKTCGFDEYGRQLYNTIQFPELPDEDSGLFEVVAAGTAGMLIQRHVFEKLKPPWFENSDGQTVNEDMEFCRKVRRAGYKILADPATSIGHTGIVTAWPKKIDGKWGLLLDLNGAAVFIANGVNLEAPPEGDFKHGTLVRDG